MTAPFETARLLCDGKTCDAEVIGSALVYAPRDADAVQRAKRDASKAAVSEAIRKGWTVARHGAKGDWCPKCGGAK